MFRCVHGSPKRNQVSPIANCSQFNGISQVRSRQRKVMVYVPLAPIRPAHPVDKLGLQMPDQMSPIATYQMLGAESHRLRSKALFSRPRIENPILYCGSSFMRCRWRAFRCALTSSLLEYVFMNCRFNSFLFSRVSWDATFCQ